MERWEIAELSLIVSYIVPSAGQEGEAFNATEEMKRLFR